MCRVYPMHQDSQAVRVVSPPARSSLLDVRNATPAAPSNNNSHCDSRCCLCLARWAAALLGDVTSCGRASGEFTLAMTALLGPQHNGTSSSNTQTEWGSWAAPISGHQREFQMLCNAQSVLVLLCCYSSKQRVCYHYL